MYKILVVVGVILALGCSGAWAHVHLGRADLTPQTSLQVGGDLALTLPENPSTGYKWSLEIVPAGLLQVTRDEYVAPAQPIPGAGGTHYFTLHAVQAGAGAVIIQYGRGWQGGEQDAPLYLALLVTGAGASAPPPLQFGREAFHPVVGLPKNDYLVVTLPDNPSTGFNWAATWQPARNLVLVSSTHRSGSELIGAPGTLRMLFEPAHKSYCLLSFRYTRFDGEGDAPLGTVVNVTLPG
jgi:inhibitor of cysteine peptidase